MTNLQFCIARADYQRGKQVFEPVPTKKKNNSPEVSDQEMDRRAKAMGGRA